MRALVSAGREQWNRLGLVTEFIRIQETLPSAFGCKVMSFMPLFVFPDNITYINCGHQPHFHG